MPHQPYQQTIPGSDTAILFVHGIVGTPDQFQPLLPLVPERWSVDNLLLPGHGGSVQDFSRSSMAQWRAHVAAHIDMLASTHQRVVLVGHSMGTLFCIDEACRRPKQITGLFLLASPLRIGLKPSAIRQSLQVAFNVPGKTEAAQAAFRACSIKATPKLWQYLGWLPRYLELFQASRQGRQQISQIAVPTIAVQSAQDELVSQRSCRHLTGLDHVSLHLLPHSRHFYYHEDDLPMLQQYFREFCAQFTSTNR